MNWTVRVRYVNWAFFALAGALMVVMPLVTYFRYSLQRNADYLDPPDLVGLLVFVVPGIIVLSLAIWSFRKADTEVPLLFWLVVLGNLAPSIPPTVSQFFMDCPPPATFCRAAGSAPPGPVIIDVIGMAVATLAFWMERKRKPQMAAQHVARKRKLKLLGAALALIASALFVWTFYDHYTHTLMDAVKAAFERGKTVGRGAVLMGGGDFFGTSEAVTLFMGAMAALMAATAAIQGSYRWLFWTWPFLLGLISYELIDAAGAIGAFGWPYRDFTEKYVWFALFLLCCGGLVLAWRGRPSIE